MGTVPEPSTIGVTCEAEAPWRGKDRPTTGGQVSLAAGRRPDGGGDSEKANGRGARPVPGVGLGRGGVPCMDATRIFWAEDGGGICQFDTAADAVLHWSPSK